MCVYFSPADFQFVKQLSATSFVFVVTQCAFRMLRLLVGVAMLVAMATGQDMLTWKMQMADM